ncbi:hypothetical protein CPC08DRAFT_764290 [Agrocybe pediades]|nr:hypothetical protein CPC08DRAFT_764290 [Agrocybe pediades]
MRGMSTTQAAVRPKCKGGRLVLANTEELHERIEQMSARNRELERALRQLQEASSDQPHPLLNTELRLDTRHDLSSGPSTSSSSKSPSAPRTSPTTRRPNSQEFKAEEEEEGLHVFNHFGTLTVDRRAAYRLLGPSTRSEYLAQATIKSHRSSQPSLPRFSRRILEVAFPETELYDDVLLSDVLDLLPSQHDAQHLCDVYLEYGKFLYSPISKKELLEEILPLVYRSKQYGGFDHHHALSLLFIVFAIGTLFSPHLQAYSKEGREYYHLAKVALGFRPPVQDTTLASIQTLVHMADYIQLSDMDADTCANDSAWMYVGQAVRLGQKIGLHLNGARWQLPEEAVERRHELFWRLFVTDTWMSVHLGRQLGISRSQYDCPPPFASIGSNPETYTQWHTLFTESMHLVLETTMGPKQLPYSTILEFDLQIRNFHVPVQWRMMHDDKSDTAAIAAQEATMVRWLILSTKESALLNLHRPYFAQVIQDSPSDIQKHRHFPSVLATYRTSWRLIHGLGMTWSSLPKFLSRVNLAWSHGFAAAVVMCSLATMSPPSHLSAAALSDLETVATLFNSSAVDCMPASKLAPAVYNLRRKAYEVAGLPNTHFHPRDEGPLISMQELHRLNGRTFLYTENQDGSFSAFASSASNEPLVESRATSVTMSDVVQGDGQQQQQHQQMLDEMHQVLAQDIKEFGTRTRNSSRTMTFYDYPFKPTVSRPQRRQQHPPAAPIASTSTSTHPLHPAHDPPEESSSSSSMIPAHSSAPPYHSQTSIQPPPRVDSFQASRFSQTHAHHPHSHSHSHSNSSSSSSSVSLPMTYQHDLFNDPHQQQPRATAIPAIASSSSSLPSTSTPYVPSSFPAWPLSTSSSMSALSSLGFQSGFSSGGSGSGSSSSGSGGGGFGGFGFASGGFTLTTTPPIVLDPSWNSFIEQLGY